MFLCFDFVQSIFVCLNMKNPAKNLHPTLLLLICLLIIVGVSKGLVMTGEKWGNSQKALAQQLPPLIGEINQNQLTELLTDGYLALAD